MKSHRGTKRQRLRGGTMTRGGGTQPPNHQTPQKEAGWKAGGEVKRLFGWEDLRLMGGRGAGIMREEQEKT